MASYSNDATKSVFTDLRVLCQVAIDNPTLFPTASTLERESLMRDRMFEDLNRTLVLHRIIDTLPEIEHSHDRGYVFLEKKTPQRVSECWGELSVAQGTALSETLRASFPAARSWAAEQIMEVAAVLSAQYKDQKRPNEGARQALGLLSDFCALIIEGKTAGQVLSAYGVQEPVSATVKYSSVQMIVSPEKAVDVMTSDQKSRMDEVWHRESRFAGATLREVSKVETALYDRLGVKRSAPQP